MDILNHYIEQLLNDSTPQAPAWNIEKIRAGKPNSWNYIDGCMIKALIEFYSITNNSAYLDFADAFIDYFVQEDGSILSYDPMEHNLDNVNAGKTLFELYRLTGKEKYRKAIDHVYSQLETQPRTKDGNFWHKKIYPNQVWLDGLYMAQPFYVQYELTFHNGAGCTDSFRQFYNVRKLMRNEKNGLYYHAYDESREMFWCDKVTGLSDQFWLRAEGWFAMALVDTIEILPDSYAEDKKNLQEMFQNLVDSMLPYQDPKTNMWYQVINLPQIKPNYPEASGSSIFAYAIMKGARLGILPASYYEYGKRAFDGICRTCIKEENNTLQMDHICLVAGLGNKDMREGTFEYYMREPIVKNDAKGVAPLILAYIETLHHGQ